MEQEAKKGAEGWRWWWKPIAHSAIAAWPRGQLTFDPAPTTGHPQRRPRKGRRDPCAPMRIVWFYIFGNFCDSLNSFLWKLISSLLEALVDSVPHAPCPCNSLSVWVLVCVWWRVFCNYFMPENCRSKIFLAGFWLGFNRRLGPGQKLELEEEEGVALGSRWRSSRWWGSLCSQRSLMQSKAWPWPSHRK